MSAVSDAASTDVPARTDAAPTGRGKPAPGGNPLSSRLARLTGSSALRFGLVVVALIWLSPTIGLFLSSLRDGKDIAGTGWWTVFTKPAELTFSNYSAIFADGSITAVAADHRPHHRPRDGAGGHPGSAGRLRLRVAGLPRPGLVVPGRRRSAGGADPGGAHPGGQALRHPRHLRLRLAGVVAFHVAFGLPFAVFLLRNFFAEIPRELLEAARLDGAGEIRLFTRVVLPLGGPAIASLGIFQFLWVWNDMLVALIFADSGNPPITVALQQQVRQFGNNIDVLAPGAFISMIIPLVVFFAFQKQFVSGMMAGAVK